MSRDEEIKRIEAILNQIISSGIEEESLLGQMEKFERGIPYTRIQRPCTIGDGIRRLHSDEFTALEQVFQEEAKKGRIIKFVPASGAASRMFKILINYMNGCRSGSGAVPDGVLQFGRAFIHSLRQFAFYDELKKVLAENGLDLNHMLEECCYSQILEYVLTEKGLNYSNMPKGLVLFHNSEEGPRTAFAEHLVEAMDYACDDQGVARVHFTVPPEHREAIENHVAKASKQFCKMVKVEVGYSVQKESSQTIAVDMENNPIWKKDKRLIFRPAGHGALLENLNDLGGDIIFIKNIDNVVPDRLKPETHTYKKVLAGYLVQLQKQVFAALNKLDEGIENQPDLEWIVSLVTDELGGALPQGFESFALGKKHDYLYKRLHRPLRVCGMVKNLGEPGGGPFWLADGKDSPLQIVESAQVEMGREDQQEIFKSSTHFNPVDLVCAVRDHKGNQYNLMHYIDYDLGLITVKSKDGQELKALELPGLWNGSMAYWNTVFVEVPLITFNPVKTVNDLLRDEHQG